MNPSTGFAVPSTFTMPSTLLIQPASPAVTALLAILFIGGLLLVMALFARRNQLSRLYAEAQYHYQALSGMLPTRSMVETAADYDAAAFRYNVVREFPLSRLVAKSWPMLGWAAQAFPAATQGAAVGEAQQPQQPVAAEYVQVDDQMGGLRQVIVGMAPQQPYAMVPQYTAGPQYGPAPQHAAVAQYGATPQYVVAYAPDGTPIVHAQGDPAQWAPQQNPAGVAEPSPQSSAFAGTQPDGSQMPPAQGPSWSQAMAGQPVQLSPADVPDGVWTR